MFRNKFTIDDNKSNDSPYGSFSDYAYLNPYNRLHDEDGEMEDSWTGLVTEYNYLKNGLINTRFEDRYTTFTENFYAEYQALQNLRLTARFGLTKRTPVRKIIILPDIPILSAIQGIICISGVAIPPIPVKIIT